MKSEKRIIIIGNYSLPNPLLYFLFKKYRNLRAFIESSEIVIRMNSMNNYGRALGEKTTVISLVNRGEPAKAFDYNRLKIQTIKKFLTEVWFTYPSEKDWNERQFNEVFKLSEDFSNPLIQKCVFANIKFRITSTDEFIDMLSIVNNGSYVSMPSTGFSTIYKVINSKEYETYSVYILGFNWTGWEGHNWDLEKLYCKNLELQYNRVKFVQ